MKRTIFRYEVLAYVEITGDELQRLAQLSSSHYDGVCQNASRQGGFLYGALNRASFVPAGEKIELPFTANQLQILAKIAEGENCYALAGGIPILGELGSQLHMILSDVFGEFRRQNARRGGEG